MHFVRYSMDYGFINLGPIEESNSVHTRNSSPRSTVSRMSVNNDLPNYEETINSLPPTYDEAIAQQSHAIYSTVNVLNQDELSVNVNTDQASNTEESVRLTNNRTLQAVNLCYERNPEDTENIVKERWYKKKIIRYSLLAVIIANLILFIVMYYIFSKDQSSNTSAWIVFFPLVISFFIIIFYVYCYY